MAGVETAHSMAHKDIDAQQNQQIASLQQQLDELKAAMGQGEASEQEGGE